MDYNDSTICFHSQNVSGISLDSYKVVVMDIIGQPLYNTSYNTSDCNNFTDIHQYTEICSPYFVHVRAINTFGSSNSTREINQGQQVGNVCSCFEARGM